MRALRRGAAGDFAIEDQMYAVVNVNSFDNVERARIRPAPASFDGEDVSRGSTVGDATGSPM